MIPDYGENLSFVKRFFEEEREDLTRSHKDTEKEFIRRLTQKDADFKGDAYVLKTKETAFLTEFQICVNRCQSADKLFFLCLCDSV